MQRINPEKLIDELASAIALIDLDISEKEGSISNIIDRSARSTLSLLMSVFKNSEERVVTEEIKDLKEQVLRLQVEVARLYRKLRLESK